ncbi:hypothetical protein [Bacillus sp. FJAT-22090]|uniref:hypothetical protein n=1 Tax=Bacillus sp. FJAT-22090 TaxID=1581038 RepID=UPI00119E49DB|nr:hypothetical protein [Bacillus sp. FJAT-22090]
MNNLNINELNITEEQKKIVEGNLKFSKLIPVSLHKDENGYLYTTGINKAGKQITSRNFKCGYWDSQFKQGNCNLNKLELLYSFN